MCCTPCLPALLGQTCCQPSRVTRTRTHWNTKYTRADMERSICMHAHTLAKHRNHDMAQERVREIYIWSMAPEQIYIHAPSPSTCIRMNSLSLSHAHTDARTHTHVLVHTNMLTSRKVNIRHQCYSVGDTARSNSHMRVQRVAGGGWAYLPPACSNTSFTATGQHFSAAPL